MAIDVVFFGVCFCLDSNFFATVESSVISVKVYWLIAVFENLNLKFLRTGAAIIDIQTHQNSFQ